VSDEAKHRVLRILGKGGIITLMFGIVPVFVVGIAALVYMTITGNDPPEVIGRIALAGCTVVLFGAGMYCFGFVLSERWR
jgi:ABC-type transport system involved in multi-copper enzyme maturation permease subunit